LFAQWPPLQRRYLFLSDVIGDGYDIPAEHERDHVVTAQHDLAEKIADLRATTLEGLRAKATVLLSYSGYLEGGEKPLWDNHNELLGWSIARDLMGDEAAKADYRL
jgi:hypothetical protein